MAAPQPATPDSTDFYPRPDQLAAPDTDTRERIRSMGMSLRVLRDNHNLSRTELAEQMTSMVGHMVPLAAITRWEEGRGLPPREMLPSLDVVLGLEPGGFLAHATDTHRSRARHLRAAERARQRTEQALREDGRPPLTRRRRS